LLKLGGEALTRDNVAVWAGKVKLSNSYGVAECAIRSVFRQDITPETDFTNCGSAVGCCVWIANPQNYEELTPIGGVGELLIEGPTVARCYLGDPKKTNHAFVSPSWLERLFPERKCRVYRTGDLVKYASDGTIRFVGRSDSQVKIHGQRCELREIEHHLCVTPGVGLAATVLATKGPYQGRLVAVVAFQDTLTQNSELTLYTGKPRSWLSQKLAELQEILVERVPAYMVPTVWIPVTSLPINPSGKMNRISIGRWLASLKAEDEQFIRSLSSHQASDSSQPSAELSDTEKRLQTIWSRVLNYPCEQIFSGTSFFRIGGDSISSMQVAALCRAEQLPMTMQDVMQHRTLHSLAACCDSRQSSNTGVAVEYKEEYDKPFPLGPIQSMFFDLLPEGTNEYDQGFQVRLRQEIPLEKIADAIAFITQRHPMLRACFTQDAGQWSQMITDKSKTAHSFESYNLPAGSDVASIIRSTRQKLDFKNGPVFVSAYADLGQDGRVLFLTAHHLVVDLVSWRVILRDIEDHIRGIEPIALTSMPYQLWLEQQRSHSIAHSEVLEQTTLPADVVSFWGLTMRQNVSRDAIEDCFTISKAATTFIFSRTSSESRIDPIDLLLGALTYSFSMVFHDRPTIAIDHEGHGREPWDSSIDLSDTVGWFATRSPLIIHEQVRDNLVECIRAMRQVRRSAPENGRRFFAARYHCNSKHRHDLSEMSFNYIGQYQQFEASDSLFDNLSASSTRDPSMPRFALIEMDAAVQGGRLSFNYEYPKTIKHQDRIKQWLSVFAQTMETLSGTLQATPPEPTLSDFPHLKLSKDDFEKLITASLPLAGISSARSVEDVYSCSPTQQGIFLSQLRDPARYNIVAYFRVIPNSKDEPISIDRLEDAWKLVVARHQILRTLILDTMEEHQSLLQVVLAQAPVKTARLIATTQSDAYNALESAPYLVDVQQQPLHALSMCAVEGDGAVVCRLEISHALIDAASNSVLISDLEKAYSGLLVTVISNPAFSSYIMAIQETSKDKSLRYWTKSLNEHTPCLFPGVTDCLSKDKATVDFEVPFNDHAALREYCTRHDVTTATVYQLAWSIILRAFTGNESTCFGFLASGRDMDIPDIQDSIGPYINMLVCAEDFKPSMGIHEALQSLQERTIESLSNQFTSLSEICHALGIRDGRLFNTVLSVQRGLTHTTVEESKCTVTGMEMEDPTEFDITINVVDTPKNHIVALTVQRATISERFAQRLTHTLSQVLSDIIRGDSQRPISDIQALSSVDAKQVFSWNSEEPATVNKCVHHLVVEQIKAYPTNIAVSAWDGDFTYVDLDMLSAKYASKLVTLGVRPETFVPFCMDKTRWSVIAILSIMRAGGACVPLDPAYPRERMETIVGQLQPPVILTSPAHMRTVRGLSSEILAVGDDFIPSINDTRILDGVDVAPSNAVYVIFTSGTTGVPKGVVWNHSTLSSSALAHGVALKYNERSRMLQFAAHVFDISVSEIITTLIFGKCIVIPSDETRISGIEQFITERQVDWAFLTPTMARLIEADQVPTLKTLVLGGESIGQDNVEKWSEKLQMIIIWGPCETCKTFRPYENKTARYTNIS
jgi:non-ribosomal peptide synthase protein (TIGR01720 family)